MSDRIELHGLRVRAVVGVLDEERAREQPLSIDVDIERPFRAAAKDDDLAATTNYAAILDLVERLVVAGRFLLLETLVSRVAHAVLDADGAIDAVHVRARKVRPPVPQDVDSVAVSCTLRRET
ncbi:MAG: dihydroneopterin aldolase [Acidobacteria bacterium]|nr:dihydroneopterin aldolase [Acidobacteriota bacterium]